MRRDRLEKIIGIVLPEPDAVLKHLNMEPREETFGWTLLPPSYRFDIHEEIDLIEEVARIVGYEKIPSHLPSAVLQATLASHDKVAVHQLSDALVCRGYQEIISYGFVSETLQTNLNPGVPPLRLKNPISSEMGVMRSSLWPGLLQTALYNQHRQHLRIRLFEIGNCYFPALTPSLKPNQVKKLSGLVIGNTYPEQWQSDNESHAFFNLKGDLELLLQLTGRASQFEFIASTHPSLHPGQAASIIQDQQLVGYLGALHPKHLSELGLKGPVYLFELELDLLLQKEHPKVVDLPKFPSIRRDIAIVVKQTVPYAKISKKIKEQAGPLLKDLQLFDRYQGKTIPSDCQSLAIALIFQDPAASLLDTEINERISAILTSLESEFAAEIRC